MKRNNLLTILIIFFYSYLSIPTLYAQQNSEPIDTEIDIDVYLNEIDQIYNEYNIDNSDKNIDSDIEKYKIEKENLESEIVKNKSKLEQNNASYTEIIEKNTKIQNEIDDLCSQIALETNSSDDLSRRIKDIENDLSNERAGIDNSEYESLSSEIEAENKRIFETGEQIKKRIEESKKLKSKFVLLEEELENYKIRDGFRDKFVDTYTNYYKAEIEYKPNEAPKLVVLTQRINVTAEKSKETGLIWKTNNTLKNKFNDCLVQYYIPLDNLKPKNIKYDFKSNRLTINSPRPVLDEDMLFIQVDPDKIDEKLPEGWFKGGVTKELKDEIMKDIKNVVLRAARNDKLRGIAEENARYHLENFFGRFLKKIPGGNEVKLEINFY